MTILFISLGLFLVGAPPFKGSNPRELFQNIRTKPLQIPSDVAVGPQSVSILKKVKSFI
jgi:hypothetical protein